MKKLLFIAILAAFALYGCTDEPMTEEIDTRAVVGSNISVYPAGVGNYLLKGVKYDFSGPYSSLSNMISDYEVRWTIGDWGPSYGQLNPYLPTMPGRYAYVFEETGSYTVRTGKYWKNGLIGSTPLEEHNRTFTVVDYFARIQGPGLNYKQIKLPKGEIFDFPDGKSEDNSVSLEFDDSTIEPPLYFLNPKVGQECEYTVSVPVALISTVSWNVSPQIWPITQTAYNKIKVTFPAAGTYTFSVVVNSTITATATVTVVN